MSDISPRLQLPFVMPAQAQKHVTVNESLQRLDTLVQMTVLSRAISEPPASPVEGDTFIIPHGATGAWAGHQDALAAFCGGTWNIIEARQGWLTYVQDEDQLVRYLDGWELLPLSQTTAMLGINGTPDTTNRFLVQSEGVLFNHVGGHQRTTLNKAASADDAAHREIWAEVGDA